MDNLAAPARFHSTREAMGTAPLLASPATPLPALAALPLPDRLAAELRRQLPPPRLGLRAAVIIPAKDEAASLPATLAALAGQVDGRGRLLRPDSFEIIVLANNCHDKTAAVVRQFAARHPRLALHVAELTLPPEVAHVGQARRLLLDEAAARLEVLGHPRALLLSTDADTVVGPTWLWATRRAVRAGAAAVGGRILPERGPAPCPVRGIHLRDASYRLLLSRLEDLLDPDPTDPWPRHHQHYGASLALTVRAYRRVGGLPVVPFLEDAALCDQLRAADLPLRHCPRVWVRTSCRQLGRVEVGLSWQLREWASLSQQPAREHHVPDPVELRRVWAARRRLRPWYQAGTPATGETAHLARQLEVPLGELLREARQATTFGQLWQWVEGRRGAVLPVPLSKALPELRRLLREHGAWR